MKNTDFRGKMTKLAKRSVPVAILAVLFQPILLDAILVAPHAIFISHSRRTAQLTLANPGQEPEEVEVSLVFGYPDTDSLGNPYVKLIENPDAAVPSAAGWIRAFPHRLRLEPGQRQVVRLLASPPAGIADGEYWSRLVVTSRRVQTQPLTPDSGVVAGLTLELRTIISVTYRKGTVNTGVELTDFQHAVEGDSLIAWVGLERTGNAAYLGNARFTMTDSNGNVASQWQTPIAVYYGIRRRFSMPLDTLPPGAYTVRFDLDTEREDIPQNNVLPADPISRSFVIELAA